MKRTFLTLLLALVLVLGLAAPASAADRITSGDWTYEIHGGEATLCSYVGTATEVTVPAKIDGYPVAELGWGVGRVFNDTVTSVTISDGVDIVNNAAFKNCIALEQVYIPGSVTGIGMSAFEGCSKLTDVTLNEGLHQISRYAFLNTGLSYIILPASVHTIYEDAIGYTGEWGNTKQIESFGIFGWSDTGAEEYAADWHFTFYRLDDMEDNSGRCGDCTTWRFDESNGTLYIESTGNIDGDCSTDPYYNCVQPWIAYCDQIKRVVVGEGVTDLGDGFLAGNYPAVTEVILPSTLHGIGNFAFRGCTGLTAIELPETCTYIMGRAFANTGLRSITLPGAENSYSSQLAGSAFEGCADLQTVIFAGDPWDFADTCFKGANIAAWYPVNNAAWTDYYLQQYGGKVIWNAYDPDLFIDVAVGSFYHEPVIWAVENGVTTGADEHHFNPNGQCLRAQVVTFLWRAEGCPEPTSTVNPFVDVKETDFYYKAVLWAVENGITNGADATHFNPFGVCNRAQVVTFLHRAKGSPAPESNEIPFTDVPADQWFAAPVAWAVENGVTNGISATEFGPNAACNRAQVVTFLYRAASLPAVDPDVVYSFTLTSNDTEMEIGFTYAYGSEYKAGDAVRFYAEPWFGYLVEFSSDPVVEGLELRYLGAYIYELTMPEHDLTVHANFVPAQGSHHTITTACKNGEFITNADYNDDFLDIAKPGEHVLFYIYPDDGYTLTEENISATANGAAVENFWFLGEFVDEYPEDDLVIRYFLCELQMPDADVAISINCTKGTSANAVQSRMNPEFK